MCQIRISKSIISKPRPAASRAQQFQSLKGSRIQSAREIILAYRLNKGSVTVMRTRTTHISTRRIPDSPRAHGLRVSADSPPASEFEPLLDVVRAAELLKMHPKTLQRLTRTSNLPAYRVGRFWRYRLSDLEMWLRSSANSIRQPADHVDFTQENT